MQNNMNVSTLRNSEYHFEIRYKLFYRDKELTAVNSSINRNPIGVEHTSDATIQEEQSLLSTLCSIPRIGAEHQMLNSSDIS